MKSKKGQYILLVLVLIVWGGIIYRFFNFDDADEEYVAPITLRNQQNLSDMRDRQAYQYLLNYPDPFLKSIIQKTEPVVPEAQSTPSKPNRQNWRNRRKVELPEVKFMGTVDGKNGRYGIFSYLGKSYFLSEGDSLENIHLQLLEQQSASLRWTVEDTVWQVVVR